ncbi:his operon leader peptide [Yersinia aleksiciae]|nr:his operon leader peptide [Yersinia aleksiciae]WQC72034.1 his operon leader peptide [Yersinia aleksiciae]
MAILISSKSPNREIIMNCVQFNHHHHHHPD